MCIVLNLAELFPVHISVTHEIFFVNETQCLVHPFNEEDLYMVKPKMCIYFLNCSEWESPPNVLSFLYCGNLFYEMVPCACNCETSMNPLMEPATSILKAWLNICWETRRWIFHFFAMPGVWFWLLLPIEFDGGLYSISLLFHRSKCPWCHRWSLY